MPTFQTLPRFERDWKDLTRQQQATFCKAVLEDFVPDPMAPDRPYRTGLRIKGVAAHPGVFECPVIGIPHPHWGSGRKIPSR
jgi:hypothetical protein